MPVDVRNSNHRHSSVASRAGFACTYAIGARGPTDFARAVEDGLGGVPKRLIVSFHDAREAALWNRLSNRPEHECLRSEIRIMEAHADDIAAAGNPGQCVLEVRPECLKTTAPLLAAVLRRQRHLDYHPLGATPIALRFKTGALSRKFPTLRIQAIAGRFEEGVGAYFAQQPPPTLVALMSGCTSRLRPVETQELLAAIRRSARPFDLLVAGFPLRYDEARMRLAHDDDAGAAKRLNLDHLRRVNRLLGGRFDLKTFEHVATYNPTEGRVETHLVSRRRQLVWVEKLDRYFSFEAGEPVLTGAFYAFGKRQIAQVCTLSGWTSLHQWTDGAGRFATQLLAPAGDRGLINRARSQRSSALSSTGFPA